MIRGTKVLIFLLIFARTTVLAQQLSLQVMVPAAGLATAGVLNYSQTVGETAVEIVNNAGYFLTQGFQQPGIKISTITKPEGTGVNVYPNPATDYVYVNLFGNVARKFRIEIISFTGMVVYSTTMNFPDQYNYIQQIDLTALKYAFYFVRVTSDDGTINRIFKIEKM